MRTLPTIYSQRDPRWAVQRLGTVDGTTIGTDGCYVTAFAMLACYYGHTVTPAQLDDTFTAGANGQSWYVDGNECTDYILTKAFLDVRYSDSLHYENVPADLAKLRQLLSDPKTSVVLEVDFNPEQAGTQTHFVVAVDCDGTNVMVADPWTGSIRNIADQYGKPETTIQKFVIYTGTPVADPLAACLAQHDQLVTLCDQKDAQIKSLTDEANAYANTITEKNTEIDALNQRIQTLTAAQQPAPTDTAALQKELASAQMSLRNAQTLISKIKQLAYGTGWPWTRLGKIKSLLSQAGA